MNPATQSSRSLRGPYQTVFVDIGETVVHIHPPFLETVLAIAADFGVTHPPDNFEQRATEIWRRRRQRQPLPRPLHHHLGFFPLLAHPLRPLG